MLGARDGRCTVTIGTFTARPEIHRTREDLVEPEVASGPGRSFCRPVAVRPCRGVVAFETDRVTGRRASRRVVRLDPTRRGRCW